MIRMAKGVKISLASSDTKKQIFLDSFRTHGVIGPACEAAGIARTTFKTWRKNDAEFSAAVEEAYEQAVDEAEAELRKRAIHGTEEPVLYKGEPVYKRDPDTGDLLTDENGNYIQLTIPRRSDRLLEVYTRTHRPQYKERSELTVVGPDGGAANLGLQIVFVSSDGQGNMVATNKVVDAEAQPVLSYDEDDEEVDQ